MYYYGLVQERRQNPQDDMISRLIAAEIPGENGEMRRLDDIEITGFIALLGGAGAETVTKLVGSAVVEFARHPEQWQMLLDDRSLVPAAVEELLRYVGPVQYNVRYTPEGRRSAQRHDPSEQAGVPDGAPPPTATRAHSTTPRRSTSPATARRRRTSASATASTAASARHWPAWRPRSHSSTCSTSCRATRSISTGCSGCTMQNVAGYHHVPVKVLRE